MFQQASSNSFYSSQRVSNYPVKIKGSIGQGSLACTMIARGLYHQLHNKNIIVSLVLIEASYIDYSMRSPLRLWRSLEFYQASASAEEHHPALIFVSYSFQPKRNWQLKKVKSE